MPIVVLGLSLADGDLLLSTLEPTVGVGFSVLLVDGSNYLLEVAN